MAKELSGGQAAAGRAVRTRRGEKRFTQHDLAELSGVSRRTIQEFESGTRWPQSDTLASLEHALGWHLGYLAEMAASIDADGKVDGDVAEQQIRDMPYLLEDDRELILRIYRARRDDDAIMRLAELESMRDGASVIPDEAVRQQIVGEFDRQIADLKRRGYETTGQ